MIIPLGGGGQKVVAAITVNYPSGSTCTCTLGSRVLTAKDTSGRWVFGLPSIGSWVIAITDGSKTVSKTISITADGQVGTATLNYETILFDGADVSSVTGGWKSVVYSTGYGSATITDNTIKITGATAYGGSATAYQTMYMTKNKIALADVSKFSAHINSVSGSHTALLVKANQTIDGWWDAPLTASTCVAYKTLSTSEAGSDVSVDISSVTDSYYLGFIVAGDSSIVISRVWLE